MLRQMPVSTSVTRQSGGCSPSISTLRAELGDDAVGVGLLAPVEEELLDDVGLVAEAQHEIAMPVLAVVLHHVPQDRLLADRDHRLGDALGVVADARAEPAAEQNDLHDGTSARLDDVTSGIGTTKLAAPLADVAHLLDDLVLQVPGQDQDVVGPGLVDRLDRLDRDVHARREAAVLVGVAVDREVEEVGADAAVVEQRVALAGRAVAADPLALLLGRDQERQQLALGALHLLGEARVGRRARAKPSSRSRASSSPTRGDRPVRGVGVREIDAQRAAVRRQLLDVEQLQTVARGEPLDRRRARSRRSARGRWCRTGSPRSAARRCGNSSVIDALRLQQARHAGDEVVEVRHLRQHVVADDEVGRACPRATSRSRQLDAEELDQGRDALAATPPRRRWRPARCRAPARPSGRKCCSR